MKKIIFALLLLMSSASSFAVDFYWSGWQGSVLDSPAAACDSVISRNGTDFYYVYTSFVLTLGGTSADCYGSNAGGPSVVVNSTNRGGDGCTSPKVYDASTGACKVPPAPTCVAPQYLSPDQKSCLTPKVCPTGYHNSATDPQSCFADQVPACSSTEEMFMGVCIPRRCAIGEHMGQGLMVTPSGSSFKPMCVPDGTDSQAPPATVDDPNAKCPDGSAPVNGVCKLAEVKNPCPKGYWNISTDPTFPNCTLGGPKTNSEVTTTTAPDGTKTTTVKETSITKNADGSESQSTRTTTTATAPDGTKTTSTSTTDKRDEATDADKADLCKQHPNLTICKVSSVAGDCAATTCEGDAITCAILQKQRQEYCENTAETPSSTLGAQLIAGNDPAAGSLPKPGASVVPTDFSGTQIDRSGFLGGGSGLTDKTLTVHGQSITIPLAQMNQYLLALRAAIMILALLASFRMVSGVIFRE